MSKKSNPQSGGIPINIPGRSKAEVKGQVPRMRNPPPPPPKKND